MLEQADLGPLLLPLIVDLPIAREAERRRGVFLEQLQRAFREDRIIGVILMRESHVSGGRGIQAEVPISPDAVPSRIHFKLRSISLRYGTDERRRCGSRHHDRGLNRLLLQSRHAAVEKRGIPIGQHDEAMTGAHCPGSSNVALGRPI